MSFEQYIPSYKGKNTLDGYSMNCTEKKSGYWTGQINFGGTMEDNLKLKDYKYVMLFTDKKNKRIAIKPTNEKSEGTRSLRLNGGRTFMTCTSWLYIAVNELGYPQTGKGTYKVLDGGLIVLEPPSAQLKENK